MSYDINRIVQIFYIIGFILLMVGSVWFYSRGDNVGMMINIIAAILILIASYFRFKK
ncbi:hypothetical protein [Methanooceanicella nereidis]|uniref:hypothetical protein n=1 Tax=Methanooceanicella nereidis TaxID=2052831 RepID=UPI001E33A265|nr:hypothetical protein [Methanocella sp. CWC-04]